MQDDEGNKPDADPLVAGKARGPRLLQGNDAQQERHVKPQ
jgi:hypothetical protein